MKKDLETENRSGKSDGLQEFLHVNSPFTWLLPIYFGINCIPPEFIWSPSPQYLRIWPYLEIGSLHMWSGKMRSYWSREVPNPIWLVSYKKGKFGNRQHTERAPSTDGGRDQGDVFTNMSSKQQKLGEGRGPDSPSAPSEGTSTANTLILKVKFWPLELWDNKFLLNVSGLCTLFK